MGITDLLFFFAVSETWKDRIILQTVLQAAHMEMTFLPSLQNAKCSSQLESSCRSSNELVTSTKHSKCVDALPVV